MTHPVKAVEIEPECSSRTTGYKETDQINETIKSLDRNLSKLSHDLKARFKHLICSQLSLLKYREAHPEWGENLTPRAAKDTNKLKQWAGFTSGKGSTEDKLNNSHPAVPLKYRNILMERNNTVNDPKNTISNHGQPGTPSPADREYWRKKLADRGITKSNSQGTGKQTFKTEKGFGASEQSVKSKGNPESLMDNLDENDLERELKATTLSPQSDAVNDKLLPGAKYYPVTNLPSSSSDLITMDYQSDKETRNRMKHIREDHDIFFNERGRYKTEDRTYDTLNRYGKRTNGTYMNSRNELSDADQALITLNGEEYTKLGNSAKYDVDMAVTTPPRNKDTKKSKLDQIKDEATNLSRRKGVKPEQVKSYSNSYRIPTFDEKELDESLHTFDNDGKRRQYVPYVGECDGNIKRNQIKDDTTGATESNSGVSGNGRTDSKTYHRNPRSEILEPYESRHTFADADQNKKYYIGDVDGSTKRNLIKDDTTGANEHGSWAPEKGSITSNAYRRNKRSEELKPYKRFSAFEDADRNRNDFDGNIRRNQVKNDTTGTNGRDNDLQEQGRIDNKAYCRNQQSEELNQYESRSTFQDADRNGNDANYVGDIYCNRKMERENRNQIKDDTTEVFGRRSSGGQEKGVSFQDGPSEGMHLDEGRATFENVSTKSMKNAQADNNTSENVSKDKGEIGFTNNRVPLENAIKIDWQPDYHSGVAQRNVGREGQYTVASSKPQRNVPLSEPKESAVQSPTDDNIKEKHYDKINRHPEFYSKSLLPNHASTVHSRNRQHPEYRGNEPENEIANHEHVSPSDVSYSYDRGAQNDSDEIRTTQQMHFIQDTKASYCENIGNNDRKHKKPKMYVDDHPSETAYKHRTYTDTMPALTKLNQSQEELRCHRGGNTPPMSHTRNAGLENVIHDANEELGIAPSYEIGRRYIPENVHPQSHDFYDDTQRLPNLQRDYRSRNERHVSPLKRGIQQTGRLEPNLDALRSKSDCERSSKSDIFPHNRPYFARDSVPTDNDHDLQNQVDGNRYAMNNMDEYEARPKLLDEQHMSQRNPRCLTEYPLNHNRHNTNDKSLPFQENADDHQLYETNVQERWTHPNSMAMIEFQNDVPRARKNAPRQVYTDEPPSLKQNDTLPSIAGNQTLYSHAKPDTRFRRADENLSSPAGNDMAARCFESNDCSKNAGNAKGYHHARNEQLSHRARNMNQPYDPGDQNNPHDNNAMFFRQTEHYKPSHYADDKNMSLYAENETMLPHAVNNRCFGNRNRSDIGENEANNHYAGNQNVSQVHDNEAINRYAGNQKRSHIGENEVITRYAGNQDSSRFGENEVIDRYAGNQNLSQLNENETNNRYAVNQNHTHIGGNKKRIPQKGGQCVSRPAENEIRYAQNENPSRFAENKERTCYAGNHNISQFAGKQDDSCNDRGECLSDYSRNRRPLRLAENEKENKHENIAHFTENDSCSPIRGNENLFRFDGNKNVVLNHEMEDHYPYTDNTKTMRNTGDMDLSGGAKNDNPFRRSEAPQQRTKWHGSLSQGVDKFNDECPATHPGPSNAELRIKSGNHQTINDSEVKPTFEPQNEPKTDFQTPRYGFEIKSVKLETGLQSNLDETHHNDLECTELPQPTGEGTAETNNQLHVGRNHEHVSQPNSYQRDDVPRRGETKSVDISVIDRGKTPRNRLIKHKAGLHHPLNETGASDTSNGKRNSDSPTTDGLFNRHLRKYHNVESMSRKLLTATQGSADTSAKRKPENCLMYGNLKGRLHPSLVSEIPNTVKKAIDETIETMNEEDDWKVIYSQLCHIERDLEVAAEGLQSNMEEKYEENILDAEVRLYRQIDHAWSLKEHEESANALQGIQIAVQDLKEAAIRFGSLRNQQHLSNELKLIVKDLHSVCRFAKNGSENKEIGTLDIVNMDVPNSETAQELGNSSEMGISKGLEYSRTIKGERTCISEQDTPGSKKHVFQVWNRNNNSIRMYLAGLMFGLAVTILFCGITGSVDIYHALFNYIQCRVKLVHFDQPIF